MLPEHGRTVIGGIDGDRYIPLPLLTRFEFQIVIVVFELAQDFLLRWGPIYGWDHGILLSCCPDPCHPPVAYMRNAMLAECYTYR